MSAVSYNGVNFGHVRTVKVGQDPQMDESNTDTLWFNYGLKVESVVTILDSGQGYPGLDNPQQFLTAADLMAEIRHMLLVPRRPLRYDAGSGTLIDIPGGLDCNNGPKPKDATLTQITDNTFRIEWECEVALADCDEITQVFASNRWEQNHDIDEKGYSIITTTGTLWTRSDMLVNPDQLRGLCAPDLPNGFRRKYSFTLQRDGLALRYHIVDTEHFLLPPSDPTGRTRVVDASGKFAITTKPPGAVFFARCDLEIEGAKGSSKADLMELCTLMALNRIEKAKPIKDGMGKDVYMSAAWGEVLFENRVNITIEAQINSTQRVFFPPNNGLFKVGRNLFRGILGAGSGILGLGNFFQALEQWLEAADKEDALKLAQAKAARDRALKNAKAENRAMLQAPPMAALGEPLDFTDEDAPGLDPGLRGNGNFLEMVAAAFRDPCLRGELARNKIKLPPGPNIGGTVTINPGETFPVGTGEPPFGETTEEAILRTNGGIDSVLRSFDIVDDLGPFEHNLAASGFDQFPGTYEVWMCDLVHEMQHLSVPMAATMPGIPPTICQICNPIQYVTLKWTAAKIGFPPEVPTVFDSNLVPTGMPKITFEQLGLAADGVSPIYSCYGEQKYFALDASKVALRPAAPPWFGATMREIPPPIPMVLDFNLAIPKGTSDNKLTGQVGVGPNA